MRGKAEETSAASTLRVFPDPHLRTHTDPFRCSRHIIVTTMQRADLVERLNQTQRALVKDETQIRRQRAVVMRLERNGKDTREARARLTAAIEHRCGCHKDLAGLIREFQAE